MNAEQVSLQFWLAALAEPLPGWLFVNLYYKSLCTRAKARRPLSNPRR